VKTTELDCRSDAAGSHWFRRLRLPAARCRLFCLPYAGGNARVYRNWHDWMAPNVEVVAMELPGRGIHMGNPPIEDMGLLVSRLAAAIAPLSDLPFALFGHSLGGLVAFELSRALHREGRALPVHLFVSAVEAPNRFSTPRKIHALPKTEFVSELRALNRRAAEALEDDDLAELVLPMLRADFRIADTYRFEGGPPLSHPLTVFGGLEDASTPASALGDWQRHTHGRCTIRLLAGDHFFIHEYEHLMAAGISRSLLFPSRAGGCA
jgi:medium-chain acyl-[acyl-carrier-protein] hydrolase